MTLYLCLCSIAVTVTALLPTRLCRIAVFLVKPTFSQILEVIIIIIAPSMSHRGIFDKTHLSLDDDSEAYCWRRSGFFWRMLPPGGVRPACWRRLPATRPAAAAACARRVCPAAACGAPAPRRPRPSDPASRVLCSASAPEPRRLTPTCLAANWPLLERCPRRWKAQRPHAKRHGQAQHSPCRRPLPRAAASRLRPAASSRSAAARIATRG